MDPCLQARARGSHLRTSSVSDCRTTGPCMGAMLDTASGSATPSSAPAGGRRAAGGRVAGPHPGQAVLRPRPAAQLIRTRSRTKRANRMREAPRRDGCLTHGQLGHQVGQAGEHRAQTAAPAGLGGVDVQALQGGCKGPRQQQHGDGVKNADAAHRTVHALPIRPQSTAWHWRGAATSPIPACPALPRTRPAYSLPGAPPAPACSQSSTASRPSTRSSRRRRVRCCACPPPCWAARRARRRSCWRTAAGLQGARRRAWAPVGPARAGSAGAGSAWGAAHRGVRLSRPGTCSPVPRRRHAPGSRFAPRGSPTAGHARSSVSPPAACSARLRRRRRPGSGRGPHPPRCRLTPGRASAAWGWG